MVAEAEAEAEGEGEDEDEELEATWKTVLQVPKGADAVDSGAVEDEGVGATGVAEAEAARVPVWTEILAA